MKINNTSLEDASTEFQLENSDKIIQPFVSKTYQILQNKNYQDIITWNAQGNQFYILNEFRFQNEILIKHFKHDNIISFIRQLNLYGFKKVRQKKLTFEHKDFHRNYPTNLCNIQRHVDNHNVNKNILEQFSHIIKKQDHDIVELNNNIKLCNKKVSDLNLQLQDILIENKKLWQQLFITQEKKDLKIQQFEHLILNLLNPTLFKKQIQNDNHAGNDDNTFHKLLENNYKNIIQNLLDFINKNNKKNDFQEHQINKKVKQGQQFENTESEKSEFYQIRKNSNNDLMICDGPCDFMFSPYKQDYKNKDDDDQISQKSNNMSEKSLIHQFEDFT